MESSTQIEEIAGAWIARRDSAGFSAADEAELTRWLQASTANRVAFIRLDAAWQQANRLKALGAGVRPGVLPAPGEWRQSPFFDRRLSAAETGVSGAASAATDVPDASPRLRALAAAVLLTIASSVGWYVWPHGPSYRTEVGGLAAVPMVDGSKVTLNTDSEIHVALSDTERRVELKQGEAFFEVAKDPKRPFIVNAGSKRIVAVGTKFSVLREADEVRVVVTEGRVRVEQSEGRQHLPVTQLSAGSVARTAGGGVLVQDKPLPQAEEYLSWRSGFVVFHETVLADAVAEFNRYNRRKLVIEDPALAVIHIGGSFRSNNLDAFVRLLQDGFAIRADARGDVIVLSMN